MPDWSPYTWPCSSSYICWNVHTTVYSREKDNYVLQNMYMQHWTRLKVSGTRPRSRFAHATGCIAGPLTGQTHPLLTVIGGAPNSVQQLADVWLLDIDEGVWSEVGLLDVISMLMYSVICKHVDSYLSILTSQIVEIASTHYSNCIDL